MKCISVLTFKIFVRGQSGDVMVLGKQPRSGLLIWITAGQGPTVLAAGAGGVVWTFLSHLL